MLHFDFVTNLQQTQKVVPVSTRPEVEVEEEEEEEEEDDSEEDEKMVIVPEKESKSELEKVSLTPSKSEHCVTEDASDSAQERVKVEGKMEVESVQQKEENKADKNKETVTKKKKVFSFQTSLAEYVRDLNGKIFCFMPTPIHSLIYYCDRN